MRNEVIIDIESLGEVALPHLWRDEIGNVFVLTKAMEIFPFSKTVLSCYCWSSKVCLQLQKTGLIYDVRKTEDNLILVQN